MNHLAAVAGSHDEREVEFCSWCGRLEEDAARVCSQCGLGVRLRTDRAILHSPGAVFLVVRADGCVSAASAAAERALGRRRLVGLPVMSLLVASDGDLARAVALAAGGSRRSRTLRVDLTGTARRAQSLHATVAGCGQPPAALVVLSGA